jgi:hypothetical protein
MAGAYMERACISPNSRCYSLFLSRARRAIYGVCLDARTDASAIDASSAF